MLYEKRERYGFFMKSLPLEGGPMKADKPYVVAIGLNDIDEYYQCVDKGIVVGDKCFIRFLEAVPGGMIANAACVMAKMGIPTYMLDTLGDDPYTEVIRKDMQGYGVNMDYVDVLPGYKNCRTEIILSEGERTILIYANDKPFVTMDDKKLALLENATYVYSLMTDIQKIQDYKNLVDHLYRKGVKFMFDAERTTFTSFDNETDRFFFDRASVLSFNDAAIDQLCAERGPSVVDELIGDTDKIVITTLGAKGCVVQTRDQKIQIDGYPVTPVDTTGAGDTFNSSFLVGLMNGWPLEKTVSFANAAAARSILYQGAKTGAVEMAVINNFVLKGGKNQ